MRSHVSSSYRSCLSRLCFTLKSLPDSFNLDRAVRAGDARALARAISTVENRTPGWSELLKALFPHSGHARILGLTGPPGAGKSTLVDQLARHYRKENRTVGIIAVDPTSPYTGGAILGDRIRMQDHFSDPGIYIRSMATRGSLGGLARTTADVATVLDASGRDLVMIETVGVGQDEVDIVRLADVTIVILVPGMGDDVQTIKAGIMEIADIFVINKSDREGAERVEREIRALQSLAVRSDNWTPPIVKTVASEGVGIAELAAAIGDYETYLQKENLVLQRNVENWQNRLVEMLRDALLERAREQLGNGAVARYAAEVAEHKRDPYSLVEEIVGALGKAEPMPENALDWMAIGLLLLRSSAGIAAAFCLYLRTSYRKGGWRRVGKDFRSRRCGAAALGCGAGFRKPSKFRSLSVASTRWFR